jgi:hypothetical protein
MTFREGRMERVCRHCGKSFAPRSTDGRQQACCSAACRQVYFALAYGKVSPDTLASELLPNRSGGRRQRFCSEPCARQVYIERNGHRPREHLLRQYAMTSADYDRLFEEQRGVCAICGRPPKNNLLAVDHDHITGRVRGLLCAPCNRHLGWYDLNKRQVAAYLTSGPDGFTPERSIHRDG